MQIKVMSSNIRYDNPADGDRSWSPRKPVLLERIHEFEPTFLGTQEGREPQIRDLATSLTHLTIVDQHRSWIEERMYPTLFFDPRYVEYIDSGDIWLSQTPEVAGSKSFESAFPRLVTWMRARLKNHPKDFIVANVHLDHLQAQTRAKQAEVLIEQLKKLHHEEQAFILMGDFNESPNDEVRLLLQDHLPELYDPWFILDKHEEYSHHDLKGKCEDGERIDWILVNRLFSPFDIYLDKKEKEGIYPSDHFPVKAILNLKE
jgi:endonuclease/exonuclease/phosphatase family metal-dependent hydrolase